jgi:hypothetical protein
VLQFELLTAVLDLLEKRPWGSGRFLPIIPTDAEDQQTLLVLIEFFAEEPVRGNGEQLPSGK